MSKYWAGHGPFGLAEALSVATSLHSMTILFVVTILSGCLGEQFSWLGGVT